MSDPQADLLAIAGITRSTFYNGGEDISLEDEDHKRKARVFRRGSKLVYRSGEAVDWDDDQKLT